MAKINGVQYDGGTIEINVEGVGNFSGVSSINYGYSKDTQKVYGVGSKALGRTPGIKNADDGSMEINYDEFHNWLDAAGGNDDFMDSLFDVTVTYRVPGHALSTVVLKDCTPISWSAAHTLGTSDKLVITVNMSVMEVSES
jgi:hypothetical protein